MGEGHANIVLEAGVLCNIYDACVKLIIDNHHELLLYHYPGPVSFSDNYKAKSGFSKPWRTENRRT